MSHDVPWMRKALKDLFYRTSSLEKQLERNNSELLSLRQQVRVSQRRPRVVLDKLIPAGPERNKLNPDAAEFIPMPGGTDVAVSTVTPSADSHQQPGSFREYYQEHFKHIDVLALPSLCGRWEAIDDNIDHREVRSNAVFDPAGTPTFSLARLAGRAVLCTWLADICSRAAHRSGERFDRRVAALGDAKEKVNVDDYIGVSKIINDMPDALPVINVFMCERLEEESEDLEELQRVHDELQHGLASIQGDVYKYRETVERCRARASEAASTTLCRREAADCLRHAEQLLAQKVHEETALTSQKRAAQNVLVRARLRVKVLDDLHDAIRSRNRKMATVLSARLLAVTAKLVEAQDP